MRNFNPFCYSPFTILFLVPSLQYCHSVLNFEGNTFTERIQCKTAKSVMIQLLAFLAPCCYLCRVKLTSCNGIICV